MAQRESVVMYGVFLQCCMDIEGVVMKEKSIVRGVLQLQQLRQDPALCRSKRWATGAERPSFSVSSNGSSMATSTPLLLVASPPSLPLACQHSITAGILTSPSRTLA